MFGNSIVCRQMTDLYLAPLSALYLKQHLLEPFEIFFYLAHRLGLCHLMFILKDSLKSSKKHVFSFEKTCFYLFSYASFNAVAACTTC